MSSIPPGAFGAASDTPWDAFTRQAFSQWSDWMRAATPPTTPDAADPLAWWTRLAQAGQPAQQASDMLGRFDAQAREWMTQMQRVAQQFAGRDATPADIAQAWRQAAGRAFDPLGSAFGGFDPQAWMRSLAPWMQALGGRDTLSLPAFGFAREHQERLQSLLRAQVEAQTESADYLALMGRAWQDAFTRFEARLAGRARDDKPLDTARGLFDLWIDAAEDAYAQVALSPEFRTAYGRHVNALMRLKAAVDGEAERTAASLNMPTRTEVDSAHRKIIALEREVRRLRDAVAALAPREGATPARAPEERRDAPAATSAATGKRARPRAQPVPPAPGEPPASLATRTRKAGR